MSIAIILSAGVGLAGVLSGFVRSAASFNSFLFGSIVAISGRGTLYGGCCQRNHCYWPFCSCTKNCFILRWMNAPPDVWNPRRHHKQCVHRADRCHSVNCRPDGRRLIVSSMMVVPVACGMQLGRSYKQTVLWSIAFAEVSPWGAVPCPIDGGLKPGGTIVLLGVACLLLLLILKPLFARLGRAGRKELKGEHDD